MYYINKIIVAFLNPLGIGLLLIFVTVGLGFLKRFRRSTPTPLLCFCCFLAAFWLWFWSTGVVGKWIGLSLEREFPPQLAEAMPQADAIVILGGGVGLNTNACPYAELFPAADRAWHAARLYRAGKAPKIFVTCEGDVPFLVDLGVPRAAIEGPSNARNTEEEARFIAGEMKQVEKRGGGGQRNKILLVTSAWHMRRALLMYTRYAKGIEVVPAATDHVNGTLFEKPLEFKDFVPDPLMIGHNHYMFKEWVGYWGYRVLRK